MFKKLLQEGPVGHMWHPFDLDYVRNGKDLLEFFTGKGGEEGKPQQYIEQFTPSIKIDGINGPIRLIQNALGEKEFAIDRMSQAPIDREGITVNRLKERFEKAVLQSLDTDEEITIPLHKLVAMGISLNKIVVGKKLNITHRKKKKEVIIKSITSGHGFVSDGGVALMMLNNALKSNTSGMEQVLKELNMWDNPNICLNNDIVHEEGKANGQVNAVKYDENFIAFHGVNEIFSPEGKKTRKTREVVLSSTQKQALVQLVKILNETNPNTAFRALSPFDTVALKGEVPIDYSNVLGEIIEVKLDDQNAVAKSLESWLKDSKIVKPSYTEKYTFADGKKRSYFSKANYVALIPDSGEEQYSVRQLLDETAHPELTEDDYYKFCSGAVFYHATRLLGRAVLVTLVNKSKVGNEALTSHEGIVMRSSKIFGVDKPIKITGDFIRDGMGSNLAQAMKKKPSAVNESSEMQDMTPEEIGDDKEEQTTAQSRGTKTVAIMPGSFKPPHNGHLQMAEHFAGIADEVLIFVSSPKGSKRLLPFSGTEISYEKAIDLWRTLLGGKSGNIRLVESSNPSPSPIMALAEIMKPAEERKYYSDFEFFEEDYDKLYLGMSEKEKGDDGSMARFDMYRTNPNVEILFAPAFSHSPEYSEDMAEMIKSSEAIIKSIQSDIEYKALELAKGLVSSRARKKLPANPSTNDLINSLSIMNKRKVAKFMKSTPINLEKENYSATDLRLLLDLKKVYNLPVDSLLKDFVGASNVEQYLRVIFGSGEVNESINVIQEMIKSILAEQIELDEMSSMAQGNVTIGGSKPVQNDNEEDDEDTIGETKTDGSSTASCRTGSSTMTVKITPNRRHDTDTSGTVDDSGYSKWNRNSFKIDSTFTDKRAPYYSKGDIVNSLVEKILHNLIRLN